MTKVDEIIKEAQRCADTMPDFERSLGAGIGDHATNHFMEELRMGLAEILGKDDIEKIVPGIKSAVDFYIKDEGTIVEIALSLKNPNSEFFKDVFKALIAKDHGWDVKKLVFISKQGAERKCDQPLYVAVREWAKKHYGIVIEINDLKGLASERT